MKIKAMQESKRTFETLRNSDLFRTTMDGNVLSAVYMKVEESYDENDEMLNAVDVSNGGRCWFSDSKPVAPVNGTFVEGYEE